MSTLEGPGARLQLERMNALMQKSELMQQIDAIEGAREKRETLLEGKIRQARIIESAGSGR